MTAQTFQISFPADEQWIPVPLYLSNMADGLLAIAGGALDHFNRGTPYERRVVVNSDAAPWLPNLPGQILVAMPSVFPGRAGQQQFQDPSGAYGKVAQRVAGFVIDVVNNWPIIKGGVRGTVPSPDDLTAARQSLWQDGFIVWSALQAYTLGGVTLSPPIQVPVQDHALLTEMRPKGPSGGNAALSFGIELQW